LSKSTTADLRLIVAIVELAIAESGPATAPDRATEPDPSGKIKGKANFGEYGAACRGLPDRDLDRSMCRELLPWSSPENIGPSL
jgi:hypothetical protein